MSVKVQNSKTRRPYAKKSLGQNFLVDQNYIDQIVDALQLKETDTVIEIGPGRGALTEKLIESGAKVLAIELDRDFVPLLRKQFAEHPNFEIFEDDALEVDFSRFKNQDLNSKIKLVANLPYYISTAILQRLIEQHQVFSDLVLMLQREVVERITAKPGNSERGFLTVLVEQCFEAKKLFDVPPEAFFPIPKVWSSIAKLNSKPTESIDSELFREIVSVGFQQKRKTILNNLKNKFADTSKILESANIEQGKRAETLTLNEWLSILSAVQNLS